MTAAASRIPAEALEAARAVLAGDGGLGAMIAEASRPFAHLSDEEGAEPASLRWLEGEAGFRTAVTAALPGISEPALDGLWGRAAGGLAPKDAMEVLLTRALDPLEGLLTYPNEVVFSPAERAAIETCEAAPWSGAAQVRPGAVTGIVKVTRLCNLRCDYCHDWRTGPDAGMDFGVKAASLRWLIRGSGARRVDVILHGGEPSLLGPRRLTRLFALEARYRLPGQQVATRMQTNGAHLTPEVVSLLARFNVTVGVSLDGPPEVQDLTRRDIRGRGVSAAARDSIGRLRRAGILSGVVAVVTPALMAAGAGRLVGFLAEEGVEQAALLPMRPAAGTDPQPGETLPTEAFCRFLVEVEAARRASAPRLRIREIDAALAALAFEQPRTCELQGHCVGAYFAIDPDGAVTHCDKFEGDADYVLGRVEEPFEAVARGEAAGRLRARALAAKAAKAACPWEGRCRGWCPHEDYVARRAGEREGCCGLAPLFEGLQDLDGAAAVRPGVRRADAGLVSH